MPERAFSKVEPGQGVEVVVAAYPKMVFSGKISLIDPKISEKTRSFSVQALLPNEEKLLNPGMFADVTIDLGSERQVIAVPATAVTFNAYGESVFLVRKPEQANGVPAAAAAKQPKQGDTAAGGKPQGPAGARGEMPRGPVMQAKRVFVETGERRGLMIEVKKGVEAGEGVVTAGQLKIDDGFPIIVSDEDALDGVRERPLNP